MQATAPAQPTPSRSRRRQPAGAVPAPPAALAAQAAAAGRGAVASRVAPAPASVRLSNFRHQWQTWNNCGPATITMATSHFGRGELQAQAATFLKPNADDKNVGPDELVAFARSVGLQADYRVGGDLERLKLLLANGVPVVAEMWFTPRPNDGMGHYRLLVGYDDVPGALHRLRQLRPAGGQRAPPVRPLRRRLARLQPHLHPRLHGGGGPHRGRDPGPGRGRRGDVGAHPGGRPAGGGGERERPLRLV